MKLVIHDKGKNCNKTIRRIFGGSERSGQTRQDEITIVTDNKEINRCIGCFGCWVKTPARCVLQDAYSDMPEKLRQADELVIISECVYGMYSPFVKNVLDRSIGYLHPFFAKVNGEMHHRQRYQKTLGFSVYYYGETTEEERKVAKKIAQANAVNLYADLKEVRFYKEFEALTEGVHR